MALRNCPFCKSHDVHGKVRLSQRDKIIYGMVICEGCGAIVQWGWDTNLPECRHLRWHNEKEKARIFKQVQQIVVDRWNGTIRHTQTTTHEDRQLRLPIEEK